MAIAVIHQDAIEKPKQVPGHAERLKGCKEAFFADIGPKEILRLRTATLRCTGQHSGSSQIIEGLTGPLERGDHILFVQPRSLMEFSSLPLHLSVQFLRQHDLETETWMLEQFVIENRPCEPLHQFRFSAGQVWLVNTVHQHHDAIEAETFQNQLKFIE